MSSISSKGSLASQKEIESRKIPIDSPEAVCAIRQDYYDQLCEEIELLDGAGQEFDMEAVGHHLLGLA